MTIITISRQFGSGGDEIASRVCDLLGYKEFDKNLIAQAAEEVGLSEQEITNFSEENHKVRNFLDRLFGRTQIIARDSLQNYDLTEDTAVTLVQKAVLSAAEAGNLVIVGRGGQVILKDQPNVIHVRIEAPLADRIQRAIQSFKENKGYYLPDYELRQEAERLIEKKDAASRDYLQRFYQIDGGDTTLYDVVINTGKVSVEQAAEIIARVAQSHRPESQPVERAVPA